MPSAPLAQQSTELAAASPPNRNTRVALPRGPEVAPPRGIPVLATIAPVFASLALWAVTQSPFALVFAALGPVIAIASVGDARLQARRQRRREAVRFAADCAATTEAIASAHARERADLEARHPGALGLLGAGAHAPELWRGSFEAPLLVRLGSGPVASTLDLRGDSQTGSADDETEARLRELSHIAAAVEAAPVVVDARLGIGIVGPPRLALAAARAIVVQLAAALPPPVTAISAPHQGEWDWLGVLPHREAPAELPTLSSAVVFRATGTDDPAHGRKALVAIASTAEQLPREARIVVRVAAGSSGAVIRHPDPGAQGPLQADFVSLEEAAAWAAAQRERATAEGMMSSSGSLPQSVRLAELLESEAAAPGLECALGLGELGPLHVDLVADGPHAIVGGTTGSGKSELLVTWVLAMAAARSPAVLTFLFVDFKGGASFEPLRGLPHCVGVITDLDGSEALRALGSLRAEVQYRERMLAEAGFRSVDHASPGTPFARLVLVVDEYAAMVEEHPELHPLFTDLASRGRSLGIHLVLCTQRPAGVVREGVLANSALRLSLRVNNRADSIAVIGTDAAATLGAAPLGRALVSAAGEPPRLLQVALAAGEDATAVADAWSTSEAPRRPWCPPLPAVVEPAVLELVDGSLVDGEAGDGVAFALADLPAEQRQAAARYSPARDGHLLVVGGSGSGKSGVLGAFIATPTAFAVARAGAQLDLVWDLLGDALRNDSGPRLVLLDDVDALVTSCPDDYAGPLVELLARALREGPGRGVHLVLTMQRIPGPLQSLTSLCGSRLVLRMPNRQEHLLAGGESAAYLPELPPGGGHWRGGRVQVVRAPHASPELRASKQLPLDLAGDRGLVAVSTSPAAFAKRLRDANPARQVIELTPLAGDPRQLLVSTGGQQPVLVGDPDTWQSHWGAIGALRASADVVFDGCSVAEVRQLTRLREVPPPFPTAARPLWALTQAGKLLRASLGGGDKAAT